MPLLPVDKNKPPILSGYRKLIVVGVLALGVVLVAIFAPEQLDKVVDGVKWLAAAYFGADGAGDVAHGIGAARKPTPAPLESPAQADNWPAPQ